MRSLRTFRTASHKPFPNEAIRHDTPQPPTYEDAVGKNSYVPEPYREAETSELQIDVAPSSGPQQVELDVPKP